MSDITNQPDPSHAFQAVPASLLAPDPDAPSVVFPLHPSFWWALLWCVFMMLVTQIPALIAAIVVTFVLSMKNPDSLRDLSSAPIRTGILVAVVVAHGLIIVLALLCLRMTAGRSWMRQVALRLPSIEHVLLTLATLPGFFMLGHALDEALNRTDYPSIARLPSAAAFWGALVTVLLLVAVLHGLCRLIGGRGWYDTMTAPLSIATKAIISLALLLSFLGACFIAYRLLLPVAADLLPEGAEVSGMSELVKAFKEMPLGLAIAVIAVTPALSEELWCRAFLGRGLIGRHGVFWGVLMTSFLFGAIHGDPRQGTYAMMLGAVMHLTYLASRSLLVPMLLHFLNNAISVVLMRFPTDPTRDFDLLSRPGSSLIFAAGFLLATCLFAFWQTCVRPEGLWKPPYPGVVCPPPESGTRLVSGSASLISLCLVVLALCIFFGLRFLIVALDWGWG